MDDNLKNQIYIIILNLFKMANDEINTIDIKSEINNQQKLRCYKRFKRGANYGLFCTEKALPGLHFCKRHLPKKKRIVPEMIQVEPKLNEVLDVYEKEDDIFLDSLDNKWII